MISLQKKDLENFSFCCKYFKSISKKYVSAALLREHLESAIMSPTDRGEWWRHVFEPIRPPKIREKWKYRRFQILAARSRLVDELTLG